MALWRADEARAYAIDYGMRSPLRARPGGLSARREPARRPTSFRGPRWSTIATCRAPPPSPCPAWSPAWVSRTSASAACPGAISSQPAAALAHEGTAARLVLGPADRVDGARARRRSPTRPRCSSTTVSGRPIGAWTTLTERRLDQQRARATRCAHRRARRRGVLHRRRRARAGGRRPGEGRLPVAGAISPRIARSIVEPLHGRLSRGPRVRGARHDGRTDAGAGARRARRRARAHARRARTRRATSRTHARSTPRSASRLDEMGDQRAPAARRRARRTSASSIATATCAR